MRLFMLSSLIALLTSAGAYRKLFSIPSYSNSDLLYIGFSSQGKNLRMAYYYKSPSKPNGKTVLLLHGKNFSSSYWKSTVNFLLSKEYAVLVPEQVGFGRSDQPLNYQFSFQQLALNTKLLLDSLHIKKVTVLGHSMGGMLGVRFARMFPENCEQLILENPLDLEDWTLSIPYASDMIFTQPVCYEFKNLSVPVVLIIDQENNTLPGKDRAKKAEADPGYYKTLSRKTSSQIFDCRLIKLPGIGHIPHLENFNLFTDSLSLVL